MASQSSLTRVATLTTMTPRSLQRKHGWIMDTAWLGVMLDDLGSSVSVHKDVLFAAFRRCKEHRLIGRYQLARTSRGSDMKGREEQGRPIGLLVSWVRAMDTFTTQDEHVSPLAAFVMEFVATVFGLGRCCRTCVRIRA